MGCLRQQWAPTAVAVLLVAALVPCPVAAHAGCGHAHVADRVATSISRSLLMNAIAGAKESAHQLDPAFIAGGGASDPPQQPPPPTPPRIWLDYQLSGLDAATQRVIVEETMPTAVRVLQKLFKVRRPITGNLLVPSGWASSPCIDAAVDRTVITGLGPGRPADYVLHVTSVPCSQGAVAYAGACAVGADGRPVMGAINICGAAFAGLPPQRQVEIATHELLHAFAFSPALFPLFPGGDPRTTVIGPYGRTTVVRSPRVAAAARAHFGCPSVVGGHLEDEGGSGSTGSHWEARLYQGELMLASAAYAGRSDKLPGLSLTMALLEDSGWYTPNWEEVPGLEFGRGAGCGLVQRRGDAYLSSARPGEDWYCHPGTTGKSRCTWDHTAVGECWRAGRSKESNFLNGQPFSYAYQGRANCRERPLQAGPLFGGQRHGARSLCFNLAAPLADANGAAALDQGAGCWDAACKNGRVSIVFHFPDSSEASLDCPAGSTIDLAAALPDRFQSGALVCPDAGVVCAEQPGACGRCVHGFCLDGRCNCALPYTGPDCATHVLDSVPPSPPPAAAAASSSGGGGWADSPPVRSRRGDASLPLPFPSLNPSGSKLPPPVRSLEPVDYGLLQNGLRPVGWGGASSANLTRRVVVKVAGVEVAAADEGDGVLLSMLQQQYRMQQQQVEQQQKVQQAQQQQYSVQQQQQHVQATQQQQAEHQQQVLNAKKRGAKPLQQLLHWG